MKKILSIALLGAGILLNGCTQEQPQEPVALIDGSTMSIADIDESKINPEARNFYSNFTTIVNAAQLGNYKPVLTRSGELDTAGLDPITIELMMLDIEDEKGNKMSFFDMSKQEQDVFLQDYTILQAAQLTKKLSIAPAAGILLKEENQIVSDCIQKHLAIANATTKSLILDFLDVEQLLKDISAQITNLYQDYNYDPFTDLDGLGGLGGGTGGGGGGGYGGGTGTGSGGTTTIETPNVTGRASTLVKALHYNGRRGDFILNIPDGATEWWDDLIGLGWLTDLVDYTNGIAMVGHAGVITENYLELKADSVQEFTIEATFDEGVTRRRIENWTPEKSYIMGLQKVTYRRSLFWGAQYKPLNQTESARLADKAETYEGRDYCSWAEFFTSKWSAPHSFTCTSFIWWCAKEEYDIKIAPLYSTWVTPVHVFRSENTYVKATVY